MHEPDSFEALRKRAYELADTAQYANWQEVAAQLAAEGYREPRRRLGADKLLQKWLTTRCEQAIDRDKL